MRQVRTFGKGMLFSLGLKKLLRYRDMSKKSSVPRLGFEKNSKNVDIRYKNIFYELLNH